jgi:glycosyltransferase involved in cell wall biosynthesis
MISIIISSANAEQLKQVTENITATIGVPFEIIAVDNSKGQQGICAVYNKGIQQAKYDVLCFMHEDVIIHTNNWGAVLKSTFDEHSDIGLLGICGGSYKPFTPSSWGGLGVYNAFYNFTQNYKYTVREPEHFYRNPNDVKLAPVACVDGVWLATTSKVAAKFKFNEETFRGFHLYDLDYSIAIGQAYKVCVTYDIFLTHLSEGKYSEGWMEDTLKLHEKWLDVLPINTGNFNQSDRKHMEKVTFKDFVGKLIEMKFPASVAHKVLTNKRYKELGLYWKLKYYVVKMYLAGKKS